MPVSNVHWSKDIPSLKKPDIAHGLEHTRIYVKNTDALLSEEVFKV